MNLLQPPIQVDDKSRNLANACHWPEMGLWGIGSPSVTAMGFQDLQTTRVGVDPSGVLILRNLLILRNDKIEKNCENADPRYTEWSGNCPTMRYP